MNVFDLFAKLSLDSSEYEQGLSDAEKKGSGFGKGLAGAAKVGVGAIAAVGTAAVAAGTAFVKGTSDVASYGDNIDKMSQKMGISATAYQEWEAVMQHSGTSMETLKAGMKTLANAVENGNDAFDRLGITQEQIASMNQEELFSATISALQNVDNETERTYLAGQLLGRGATELGALLNTSAEDTQAMKDRVHELGGVMSDEAVKAAAAYQDQLQDMQTAFSGLSRNLLSEFMPSLTNVMGGLTEIFSGNYDEGIEQISKGIDDVITSLTNSLPKVLDVGVKIIESIAKSLLENIPKILPALVDLVLNIADMIIQNLPLLVDTGMQIILQLALGLAQALPTLLPTIVDVILTIVQILIDNLPLLIDGAIQLIMGIVEALPTIIQALIDAAPQIISSLVAGLLVALPQLIEGAVQLVIALVAHLPEIILALIEAIPEIIQQIGEALITNGPILLQSLATVGQQLLQAIITFGQNLIQTVATNMQTLITTVVTWISQLPAKVAYWVGEMIAKFINLLVTLPQKAQQVWSNFIANVQSFGMKLITEGPKMAREFGEKLINKLKELPDKMLEIGHDIVEGLKNGIKNAWTALTDWVKEIAGNLVQGFKDNLKIGSPSKVFADEIGQWIPAGIAEGIKNNSDVLYNTIDSITSSIVPATNPLLSSISNLSLGTARANTEENQNINVYVSLEGDADRLFRVVQAKAVSNHELTGRTVYALG